MSGLLLLVCTWGAPRGPPAGPVVPMAPLVLLAGLAEAAAAGLLGPHGPHGPHGPMASPRMDFDEWTPLGHGDPLKNDPTFDYVPPVLDRVHYWMEEGGARRDLSVDLNAVPVPATMLVPPPPPQQQAAPTTPPPAAGLTAVPPAYSSLNPFHHFEDRPVVPNVLFEEKPFGGQAFEQQAFAPSSLTPSPSSNVQHQSLAPLAGPTPLALLPTPAPRPPSPNAIRAEPAKGGKLAPPRGPPPQQPKPPVKPAGRPSAKPTRHDDQPQLPPPPHLPPQQQPPPPPKAPQSTTPPPATTTTTPTTTSLRPLAVATTTSSSISSLVRGLLHREAATTASTMTTDPLFAHYKQPSSVVQGPAYLIIQGHSKVKTYGPVLRRI